MILSSIAAWTIRSCGVPLWASILSGFLFLPALAIVLAGIGLAVCAIDDALRRRRATAVLRRLGELDAWEAPDEMYEEELNRLRSVDAGLDLAAPLRERLLADGKSRDVLLRYLAARRDVPAIRALLAELAKRGDALGWRARRWVTSGSG